ncbi:sensor histidine kinase [Streptomonospora litoralis]|uniref:histidine kinase n=1 Tax=Streptomonospora litoralis TaxID=2498135 RepID=A0A4P6Q7K5_9ACTN|nr:HAMP domain-containing sensor histidine kinase [Streptomonospora litoralis]QBI55421.1 putative sensor histidine kinase TcrY [Streptomonospora litoralis]
MTTDGGRNRTGPAEPADPAAATVPQPSFRAPSPPAADPSPTHETPAGDTPRRRRVPVPARARIMAWVLLLMTSALVLVNVATWQALRTAVDDRIDRALSQEIGEFREFAAVGTDPATQRRFADLQNLFRMHISQQHPDRNEIIFGYVEDSPQAAVPTGRIRQGQKPPFDASADVPARESILTSPNARGVAQTPAGLLRWEKLRVTPPGGASAANPPGWFVIGYFVDADMAEVNATMRTLVLVSIAGLAFAGAAAWWVAGQILAPIRLVRQAAAQITEEDLTRRIDVPGNDDVAALAEQFNAMVGRLEEAFSAQRRFVDDAGHELRTPITVVRGHLEVMGDDPQERRETVRLVTDELDRMARIVEELLLLAKVQRPDFLQPGRVSLAELTSDVDAKVRALGDRDWRLDEIAEGTAYLDPQRITQAMQQLAHNAFQHTEPGAAVRTGSRVSPDGRTVSFWVGDSGPGIAAEDQERIFERFSRAGHGNRADRSGAGLGLAIVRAIADAHYGDVLVRSAPGEGALFTLVLPVDVRSEQWPAS